MEQSGRPLRVLVTLSLGIGLVFAAAQLLGGEALRVYSSADLGITFRYPGHLALGRYKPEPEHPALKEMGLESPFNKAVVLVEPKVLGTHPLTAIPVGEVPTISLNKQGGTAVRFSREQFFKKSFERTIGSRAFYQLPGYPGPYGDQGFYYIVPLANDNVLEITAHRYYFREPRDASGRHPETHYDKIIEVIIQHLEETKR
jgi:hypothetical protein